MTSTHPYVVTILWCGMFDGFISHDNTNDHLKKPQTYFESSRYREASRWGDWASADLIGRKWCHAANQGPSGSFTYRVSKGHGVNPRFPR